jgi:hypothetical protein
MLIRVQDIGRDCGSAEIGPSLLRDFNDNNAVFSSLGVQPALAAWR